ncbi:MAG: monofunctional biosynthetic peptidoglycan transglycosylase [Acidobacteriaceae bacterium]|nr:monofunctional biosynthetic peptidoglycan transglycosylase [Acidobacteriaceae bacterium]
MTRPRKFSRRKPPAKRRHILRTLLLLLFVPLAIFYAAIAGTLLLLRWINPPFTAVQVERRISSWSEPEPYTKHYKFVPLNRISPNLQHAAIAAEDARFYQHHGFDWNQIRLAAAEDLEEHRERGASTITQQLVRNLFLSTNRSIIRKALEFSMVPLTEGILTKNRILELYLNVIEWGRGVFGAEAASRAYFGIPAQRLSRLQAAQLVSVLPSPLHRKPGQVMGYTKRILVHMAESDW